MEEISPDMSCFRLIFLLLTIYCTSIHAQNLTPSEFLALKNYRMDKIDSLMTAKGFEKQVASQEKKFSIIMYTYRNVDGSSLIQRSLHIGWQKDIHALDLQYGMWQKTESADFIRQLLQDGYKKIETSMPDIGGGSGFKTISYKKGTTQISYKEEKQGSVKGTDIMLYIFSFSNENYKP